MGTTHTLTGNLSDAGIPFQDGLVSAWIVLANVQDNVLFETSTNGWVSGRWPIEIAADGAFSVDLPSTALGAGFDPDGGFAYRLLVRYRNAAPESTKNLYTSAPFELALDRSLTYALGGSIALTAVSTADYASFAASILAAEAAAAAAEAARDAAIDISGISTSDGVVQALVKNTGGAGPLTSAALQAAYAPRVTAPQAAIRRMASGQDARILVITDSTGDSTTEWPYLLASHLGTQWTGNTARWIPAASTGDGYDAPTVISIGSGSGTTTIYSASLSGRHSMAFQGQGLHALTVSTNPHLILIALGHNDGLFTGDPLALGNPAEAFRLRMFALTESIRQALPNTPIMLMSQSAWQDGGGDMRLKRDELQSLAQARGYDFLDIYQAWIEATTTGFYLDNVHPNATGQAFMTDIITAAFRPHYDTPPRSSPPSLMGASSRSLIPPLEMPVGATAPLGWAVTNATVTRNTTQYETTRGYAVRLVRAGASSQSYISSAVLDVNQVVPYRGQWVTLAARVRRIAASRFVGRLMVSDSGGLSKALDDDYAYGEYAWVFVPHKVALAATSLTVTLFADATADGSAASADVSFDRLALFPGLWPTGHAELAPVSDGAWRSYTPTLGNFAATIDWAKYTMLNAKTVKVQFAATLTGAMTGQPTITLPIQAAVTMPNLDKAPLGIATAFDTGTARYNGPLQKINSTTVAFTGSPGAWSATVPFTWVAGDVIAATFEYQID